MKQDQAYSSCSSKSLKRRISTDCNYAVLSTLLMRFLKEKNLYLESRQLARRNEIKEEKNYSIIVMRIAFFIFKEKQHNIGYDIASAQIFEWLGQQADKCVGEKYGQNTKQFKKMAKEKIQEILQVLHKVFSKGNFSDQNNIKELIIKIYQKKKTYSKTHHKNAEELAKLICGIIQQGESYHKVVDKNHFQNQSTLKKTPSQNKQNQEHILQSSSTNPHCQQNKESYCMPGSFEDLDSLCDFHEIEMFNSSNIKHDFLKDLTFTSKFIQRNWESIDQY